MATAGELHPTEGIRLLLERKQIEDDGASASYRATIYTPTEAFEFDARLERGGRGTVAPTDESTAVDPSDQKRLENLVRSTARAADRKVADGLPPWPERIMRWRGPGRG